jgi:peptide/nickel transport system substrate-binding protein
MIKAAVFGEGTRMASYLTANSWAYDKSLTPIAYDPEGARAILEKVGWVDDDGDEGPDNTSPTPRVAKGVKLPDGTSVPDGTVMSFTMLGNEGNTRRAAEGQLIQDELKQIGVDAQYQAVDFATWQDTVNAQTFDAVMLAWSLGYPDDPDATQLYDPISDVIGSGNDFTSYNNPEFSELNKQARTLPGCDQAARAEIYHQMQAILQDDVPYLWMYSINGMYAASANVANFGPYASQPRWNVDAWYVQ